MPLDCRRRLCILLLVLSLTAMPQALLATPRPEATQTQLPNVSSLLTSFWTWLGLASTETRCVADPNGGQCSPSDAIQLLPGQQQPLQAKRASSRGSVGSDTRCILDPNGQCASGSSQHPAPRH